MKCSTLKVFNSHLSYINWLKYKEENEAEDPDVNGSQ